MAHNTLVYGRINSPAWKTKDFYKLHLLNERIISELPEFSENIPSINKTMFSTANEQGTFRQQVITFGASYKSLEYEWELWLEKFESILSKLYWLDVKIYVDFELLGDYKYEWNINNKGLINLRLEEPKPTTNWTFKSDGPRTFVTVL
ncbi:hypothetical protein QMK33_11240 [Hymenobacter sp. H14-R3]|uniref:hypothetical protein n=1 Tax=Hymenobacter sp. H14-R3 TaxID=3046308 RepID=UPI0024B8E219|nr:hypothetical protein [Hymenobacter sp. H14-R3]MDJ0365727.1 hypothetical protein [Hymenobacter sp. H14-R3]